MTLINSTEKLNLIIDNLRSDLNDLTKKYRLSHEEYEFLKISADTLIDNFEEYNKVMSKEA